MSVSAIWMALFACWLALEVYVGVATRTKGTGGKVSDHGSLALLWTTITASITFCEWYRNTHPSDLLGGASWLKWAGVALLATGLVVRFIAIRTLGKAFSANVAIRDAQRVCRRGLYATVRHPSYLGMVLIFAGIGVHARNVVSLCVVVVVPVAALLYRIHVEEIALNDAFGDEYAAYSRETWRLVPFLY